MQLSRDNFHAAAGQRFTAGGRTYELQGQLDNGAIGVVRKARDTQSGQQIAVKFLAPELKYIEAASIEDIARRFRREGERGVSLRHPNLVEIIAYSENHNGESFEDTEAPRAPFLVMEFVRGKTLESLIKANSTYPHVNVTRQTLHIAVQMAEALVYLHDRKIVHRDVKPANVFLSTITSGQVPSSVKLGDFGVVRWGDFRAPVGSGTLTVTGQQGLGTFKYMSPEQALEPRTVTVRADMYSFGVTLFELFSGHILPTPHHVFQVTRARMTRGGIHQKLYELGIDVGATEADATLLFKDILDLFLTGASGRPSSKDMRGRLSFLLERLNEASATIDRQR